MEFLAYATAQPPSGGCVLKQNDSDITPEIAHQPPSGGCVLKHRCLHRVRLFVVPAAFGRLCIETIRQFLNRSAMPPAAFGRLCVETTNCKLGCFFWKNQPPSGGCVLKRKNNADKSGDRHPAAFGRLCVETCPSAEWVCTSQASRLRAAVC